MKRMVITGLSMVAILMACSSCVKMQEEMETEVFERPGYDLEIPVDPAWDSVPPTDNETGH